MPRLCYFDCYSGASGDMVLGALVDAGLSEEVLRAELAKLGIGGFELETGPAEQRGLVGTRVRVALTELDQPPRHLSDIERIIEQSTLDDPVKARALAIFRRLGAAEGTVHGIPVEQVHFHEVGAVDAIVDIVGACVGLHSLGIDSAFASSVPLGHGTVRSAHGPLPSPAPATLALLAEVKAPTRPVDIDAELLTPTGAAILATVAEFRQPAMTIDRIGVGFGTKVLPWPNLLRLWIGHAMEGALETGEVVVIESNLDDCLPEQLGFAMERLFEAGALDVFFTPIQMKKNRPGVQLSVLAAPARAAELARLVLTDTPSLGVRFRPAHRLMAPRRSDVIETSLGPIAVKIKTIGGRDVLAPEYEACAVIARARGLPLSDVYAAVIAAGQRGQP